MRTHHAGQRSFIGERQRRVAQRMCARYQFFRVRGTAEEAEVAAAMQLGIGGEHGAAGASGRLQSIEGAAYRAAGHVEHVGVDHGGADVAVAQQLLHGAYVGARL